MSASKHTKLILALRSGNVCAFPNCSAPLSVDGKDGRAAVIGEAAHIAGEKPGSARFDDSMTEELRNHISNLIYLCPTHHTQIDKCEDSFSVASLQSMKAEHEAKVHSTMVDAFAGVGFPELAEATNWITRLGPGNSVPDFTLLPLEDKLQRNALGENARVMVTMGLGVAAEVSKFVQSMAQTDPDFPERLKLGFLNEYYRLREDGCRGDALFELMCEFSQRGHQGPARRAAGLAVLVHLFEACEVFER